MKGFGCPGRELRGQAEDEKCQKLRNEQEVRKQAWGIYTL